MKEGSIVKGKVTGIKKYGAFVKVEDYDGLVHISEFSDDFVKDISSFVSVGEVVDLKVLEIDEKNQRLKLSYKDVNQINKKILKFVKIEKGFKSLEEHLDDWITDGYELISKRNGLK